MTKYNKKKKKGIYFSYDATLALTALMIGMIAIVQFTITTAETPSDQIQTSEMKIVAEDAIMTAQHQGILKEIQQQRAQNNDNEAQNIAEDHFDQSIQQRGYNYGITIETNSGTETLVNTDSHESSTVTQAVLPPVEHNDQIHHSNQIRLIIYN